MAKGLFITATGTDTGKTYTTALIIKKLRENGLNAGYYKAVLSGADSIADSDAGYVNRIAGINQAEDTLVSYIYKNPLSPHLSARIEGNPVEMSKIKKDFNKVADKYDYVTVEGAGGIVCPIRHDEKAVIFLEDIINELSLSTLIIADAGLGTINSVVTTVEYMRSRNIGIKGIMLNNWNDSIMHNDNLKMIEEITGISVCAVIKHNENNLNIDINRLEKLYEEI